MFEHCFVLSHRGVGQHLCGERYGGYGSFELVCHVVYEVVLHLRILSLAQYKVDYEHIHEKQNHGKHECRHNEAYALEYVAVHVGEMQLDYRHVARRIVGKEYSCHCVVLSIGTVVRAAEYFLAVVVQKAEVIGYVYSVVCQFEFQASVKVAKINPLVYGAFVSLRKKHVNHFV